VPGKGCDGMGTIKAIGGILMMVAAVYLCWTVIPPELTNYSFQDDLRTIAMTAGANPHETDQDILASVLKKAQEHEITLTPEQVTVTRIGNPGSLAVFVAADYSVPVDMPGYPFTLHFTPSSGNKGF
jgi:hypothetical protein